MTDSVATELTEIMAQLQTYNDELINKNLAQLKLNQQIAEMRAELSKLQDETTRIKHARIRAERDKESLERKLKLENDAKLLEENMAKKRAEALELIKDAAWFSDAFGWQIDGAIELPERALLGDKRGMGKTFSSVIWRRVNKSKKTLICLRKEVAPDFIKELSIREPDVFVFPMMGGSDIRKMAAMMLAHRNEEFIVVTNIESWRRDVDKTIAEILKIPYDAVILDEAHNTKNIKTGTAQGFHKLAAAIPKVLEMTGTPIKNRPQEMFSLLHALYPENFPDEKHFLYDYCVVVGQNKWAFSEEGLVKLVKKINHFYLARTPEDVGRQIPPPRLIDYELDMDNHVEQHRAYKIVTERNLAVLNSGEVLPITSILAIMTRQAQMVSWPAGIRFEIKDEGGQTIDILKFDVHQSVKLDWAEDLLGELKEEGERTVVFSRFKPALYELKRRLEFNGLRVAVITGDEKGDKTEIFNDFDLKTADKENYKYDVLLATYATVGESANFNAAAHMILLDRNWNPGNDDQAMGRIDRINSVRQATIHRPHIKGTIDEYMISLIEDKKKLITGFTTAAEQQAKLADHLRSTL